MFDSPNVHHRLLYQRYDLELSKPTSDPRLSSRMSYISSSDASVAVEEQNDSV